MESFKRVHNPSVTLSRDPKSRTRFLSSFDSVDDVRAWLLSFGVYFQAGQLEAMWEAIQWRAKNPDTFSGHRLDYRLSITGKEGRKPGVQVLRQLFEVTEGDNATTEGGAIVKG